MKNHFPLLLFPQAKIVSPKKKPSFSSSQLHFPEHGRQVVRLGEQLTSLQQNFEYYKASVNHSVLGLEPEMVLVIEIAGRIDDFRQAVEEIGLEWFGEWGIDDISPSDDFYEEPKTGVNSSQKNISATHINKKLSGSLFLSLSNEAGMRKLLSLWKHWKSKQKLPRGRTKWQDIFDQIIQIRHWGIKETLDETGMRDRWHDLLESITPGQSIPFQIELFYRKSPEKRRQRENAIRTLLANVDGRTLGEFIDIPDIAFHAVKAALPEERIRQLLSDLDSNTQDTRIQLFKFSDIMHFRPTGQSLAVTEDGEGGAAGFPLGTEDGEGEFAGFPLEKVELPPVAAILDGAPNLQHKKLKDRLLFDDPDNLAAEYQPGQRKHGTAMASLVIHGDPMENSSDPLQRLVYMRPIMQPDPNTKDSVEHFPDEIFFEDRIERAVRRMFEGEGTVPAQAPGVRVINLSIGDPDRPFIHTPSPWARLLDWLSWKYRVLFCVSAGNYSDAIDIGIHQPNYMALADEEKVAHVLKCIQSRLSGRRILSPAESINSISVGAIHTDNSGDYPPGQRTDLLPHASLFSPTARLGHGFRRSIKPEIFFPGGRQLYRTPALDKHSSYNLDSGIGKPGQKVAWDSNQPGDFSKTAYTRGSSNATALATRSAARIYEVLNTLRTELGEDIPEGLISVLIKALLVHGAKHDDGARRALDAALRTPENSRKFKELASRYLGYGIVDIERVLGCTEQRGTVLGCGEIHENKIHEYKLPLPPGLASTRVWRRMVVTLAWFTPINPSHRNLREAKLEFSPTGKWDSLPLKLTRQNADHHQVLRGTVQHEVLESEKQIEAYQDDHSILLQVACKKDATTQIDHAIPYGLAVTLEVEDEDVPIPIYEQLRARLQPRVAVDAVTGTR
ncbi:exopolyphosphatase [Verminephrobacter aporrectodeae subsp. tuberculatae]|uniref:S8 family peptidase n=1 Tax=Verminephrobacter aporrectodeae TaxID=1110389 RepID=UPI0022374E0F|nr:S8 family peptidase [Verminephrobacter aporrectodeae]MCW5222244.1 exopolyphosphatase [Verminephrobacter aporrectodeae subsp. tuberculatae]MCW5287708.1 exopolyphosphatase [Verminephrobacter aporrectodeae subsp. tuberculatae]